MDKRKLSYAVKRTATGLGLIAVKTIPKGTRIVEYLGPLVSNDELEKRTGKYFMELNSKWCIDGSSRSNVARYINHSCEPNSEALISGRRVWVWSTKRIAAGEEITSNYGKEYFDFFLKSKGCRCEKCNSDRRSAR